MVVAAAYGSFCNCFCCFCSQIIIKAAVKILFIPCPSIADCKTCPAWFAWASALPSHLHADLLDFVLMSALCHTSTHPPYAVYQFAILGRMHSSIRSAPLKRHYSPSLCEIRPICHYRLGKQLFLHGVVVAGKWAGRRQRRSENERQLLAHNAVWYL